jgi:hypothetical protein
VHTGVKERFNSLTVYRDPNDDKTQIFTFVKETLDSKKDAEKLAKIIVYSKIYFNTVAYGTFHKKKFDLGSFKKYLNVTSNPLLAGQSFDKEKENRDKDFKKTRKELNLSNRRVYDIEAGWASTEANDVFETLKSTLNPLFPYLKLKDDFTPIAAPRSNPRPQSARAPAKAAAAAPPQARPASAGGKKGATKSAIQKKKQTPGKPVKAKPNKVGKQVKK